MRSDSLGLFWYDEPPPPKEKKTKPKKTPPEPVWENDDYLPGLEEALSAKYNQFTDQELFELSQQPEKAEFVFDIESYPNYFLVAFKELKSKKLVLFEGDYDVRKLKWMLQTFVVIGFNSRNYDIPMATVGCREDLKNPKILKQATDLIIQQGFRDTDIYKQFKVKKINNIDHIDLIEVLPLDGSLKIYAGRIHAPKLQDLPFHPDKKLSEEQKAIVRLYCINDLLDTELLYQEVSEQINLRRQLSLRYKVDLRSKSDAQIAESVIRHRVEKRKGRRLLMSHFEPGQRFKYHVPYYMRFKTPMMNAVLNEVQNCDFVIGMTGRIGLPESLHTMNIRINQTEYQMGIGGLHSKEKSQVCKAENGKALIDFDVTSYYPSIIINQSLAPENLGRDFLLEYKDIVEERIAAKHKGDKVVADALKITVNGSFGKFGNLHSIMYSPQLVIQVTVTGQLSLLMLIEEMELNGIEVVSANTDGIVIHTHQNNQDLVYSIVKEWERITNFETEETRYTALYSRDVNNYIAIKEKGGVKIKGVYRTKDLSKNPVHEICSRAVVSYLTNGTSISSTVQNSCDIRDFLSLRRVKGGAYKDGVFLGKTVRWYKSTECPGAIIYAKSGNDVPVSDGCRPLQVLPNEFPQDIDFEWYIQKSYEILKDFGLDV